MCHIRLVPYHHENSLTRIYVLKINSNFSYIFGFLSWSFVSKTMLMSLWMDIDLGLPSALDDRYKYHRPQSLGLMIWYIKTYWYRQGMSLVEGPNQMELWRNVISSSRGDNLVPKVYQIWSFDLDKTEEYFALCEKRLTLNVSLIHPPRARTYSLHFGAKRKGVLPSPLPFRCSGVHWSI